MHMRDLSPPPELDALREGAPLALFLDFDGTLVDLAPTPDSIHVPATLAGSLHDLSEAMDGRLALVSGRAIVDLEKHLGPLQVAVSGSHGGDCRNADGQPIGDVPDGLPADLIHAMANFAAEHGVALERKPHGAALHFRSDPSLEGVANNFAEKCAAANGLDVKRGKCVIELVGQGANKGAALRALMAESPFEGAVPVFVGDDITDEDGMRAAAEMGGFGIIVGERETDAAKYALESPAAVQHWLQL